MSSDSVAKDNRDGEVDLLQLLRKMGNTLSIWFTAIGKGFLVSVVFLLRNVLWLALSVALGIGLSYIMKWSNKPHYRSEITLRSNTVPNAEVISHFNKLKLLLRRGNKVGFAETLEISPEEADRINDVEAFWVIDRNYDSIPDFVDYRGRHSVYDTINVRMKDRFVIRVDLSNPEDIPLVKNHIISYVNNNPVFRQQNEFRLKTIDELITRLNYDIKQLDSLQKVKYFEETRYMRPEKGGQMIFLQEHATQLVYGDIYALYNRKQQLDREKVLYPDVVAVISDFYRPAKRYNGGWYYGEILIPVCLGGMFIYLIIRRNRKKLKEVFNKY